MDIGSVTLGLPVRDLDDAIDVGRLEHVPGAVHYSDFRAPSGNLLSCYSEDD